MQKKMWFGVAVALVTGTPAAGGGQLQSRSAAASVEEPPVDLPDVATAPDLIAQGNELLDAGRFDDAAARFALATEREPDNALAWASRGFALARGRKQAEATEALDRAERLDPDNLVMLNGRGALALQRRDYSGAADVFGKAVTLNRQDRFARSGLVEARLNLGQADLALEELAREAEADSHYVDAYTLRAFILMTTGHRDEVPAELEALLAANPDNTRARALAGQFYFEIGMTDKAEALFGRTPHARSPHGWVAQAAQRDPGDVEGRLADLGEALIVDQKYGPARMMRAQTYYGERRYDETLADTAEVLRNDPAMAQAYLLRANAFQALGRRDQALAEAEAVVAASPDQAFAHVVASKIYAYFDMRAEALSAIDRALAIKPEAYIYLNRSEVRDPLDWDSRLSDVDEALRLDPRSVEALYAKAGILQEKDEFAAAAEVYSQLIQYQQPSARLFNSRGMALARAGRAVAAEPDFAKARELAVEASDLNGICYSKALVNVALERALEECEESLRLRPEVAATLDSRGTVLLRLGRFDEAIRDFDEALKQYPSMTTSLYLRAMARSETGDTAGAQADLARVRELNPPLVEWMERRGFVIPARSSAGR